MKLDKKIWKEVKYGDYVDHIEKTETNLEVRKSSRFVSVEHIETAKFEVTNWSDEELPTFFRTFKTGQVLFAKRRAYQRKVAIANFDGICSPHIWALEAKKSLSQDFLPYVMLTEKFYEYVNENSAGTMSPYVKWAQLSKYTFLLPPHDQQEKISSLFKSIETAIEDIEKQEKNLKALQKSLVGDLMKQEPVFGNQLNSKNCTATSFGEIAECDKKYPEHEKEVSRFVGLEFIEAENFQLQGWGDIAKGTTFSKRFATGDVLFGKRRAYLKKVAVADFDGICSGDILVIRSKAKKMLQGLLPYYISSDVFIQHAINTSAGSLSPRTKWKDLAELKISIPDLKTQEKILEVLTQLLNTMRSLHEQKKTLQNLKNKLLNEILG